MQRPLLRIDADDRSSTSWVGPWDRFWFSAVDPIGLHLIRALLGVVLILWWASFAGQHRALLGPEGWMDKEAYDEAARLPTGTPMPIGWSPLAIANGGWAVDLFWCTGFLILAAYTWGLAPRVLSILAWLVVVAGTSNPALTTDADAMLLMLALYVAIGYLFAGIRHLPRTGTWTELLTGPKGGTLSSLFGSRPSAIPSVSANLALRLLQIHLAIVLFTSGIHKLQISVWWAGAALWFPLHPPFETSLHDVLAIPAPHTWLFVLSLASYVVIGSQLAFPFVAWRRGAYHWLIPIAGMSWLGVSFVYQLPWFGPALLLGTMAFVPAWEWRGILRTASLLARRRLRKASARRLVVQKRAQAELVSAEVGASS